MRVASLAVGIVDYRDARLSASLAKLQFAAEDARAFHRYAAAAWPGPEHLHLLIVDAEAGDQGVEDAFRAVAAAGDLDLFLLYLSGHGETGEHGGWFCLADARSGSPSLDSARLDRLLSTLSAVRTFVVADYCFAEASLSGSNFFSTLGPSLARLFVASARRSQKAWEDDGLKRSILSDILLRSLASTSPLTDREGMVEVGAKLLPYLREQVPLEAASRKRGAVQEPVEGGVAAAPIRLPTVSARDMRRPLTVTQALRARLRKILGGIALAIVGGWLVLDLLLFHLALGPAGAIEVRPGPAALYSLAPFHLGRQIDTGFTATDLSRGDQAAFRRLSRGADRGFTTRRDRDGLATWLVRLEPALDTAARMRTAILVRRAVPRLDGTFDAPPVEEAIFLAASSAGVSRRAIADQIYPAPDPVSVECGTPIGRQVDFSLLDVPGPVFARDLAWRALRIDHPRYAPELQELVKSVAYRTLRAEDPDAVAGDLEALANAAALVGSPPDGRIPRFAGWCESAAAALLRALVGSSGERATAEAALSAGLPRTEPDPGADWLPPERSAIHALAAVVARRAVRPETVAAIVDSFEKTGDTLGNQTLLNSLLMTTAAHQALPPQFRRDLMMRAIRHPDELEAVSAVSLLARNWRHLSSSEIAAIRRWFDAHGEQNRISMELHHALGDFSRVAPLRPAEIGWLADRLSPYSWLPPATASLRGELVIATSDAEAVLALAKAGDRHRLPADMTSRLRTIAASRLDIPDRETLLTSLASPSGNSGESIADAAIRSIRAARRSALERQLAVDTAAAILKASKPAVRAGALKRLLERWQRSQAPEERFAIGTIIGRSALNAARDPAR